jgi:hypothetical protein
MNEATTSVSAQTFRFDQFARVRQAFAPRKPRHRVLRVVLGLIGLTLLAVLVMFGLFVGAAMIVAGVVYKLWKHRGKHALNKNAARSRVLDGEYRIVDPLSLPR